MRSGRIERAAVRNSNPAVILSPTIGGRIMKHWHDRDGSLVPAGEPGEIAVGFYHPEGGAPELFAVETREEADAEFLKLVNSPKTMKVVLIGGPHDGRPSAVVFIVRCEGGTNWTVIKETEGMRQEFPFGRLDIPDLEFDYSSDDLL